MESIQSTLIKITRPPTIYKRANYLIGETIGVMEKVALLLSIRTGFDPKNFPWIKYMTISDLSREIEKLSASITIPTVRVMLTPILAPRDELEEETQKREIQLDALDLLFHKSALIDLKYYMMSVLDGKVKASLKAKK